MALSKPNPAVLSPGERLAVPVKADQDIYAGGSVCRLNTDGYARPAADTANFIYSGEALETVDTTGESDGDTKVVVQQTGNVSKKFTGSLTQADAGKTELYISDDETVAPVGSVSNSVKCGLMLGFDPEDPTNRVIMRITGYAK